MFFDRTMIMSPPYFLLSALRRSTLHFRPKSPYIHTQMAVSLRAASTFPRVMDEERIYVLGIGNVGKLFAHSLARKERSPPITLLLHRQELLGNWKESGRSIELIAGGISKREHLFDVELLAEDETDITPSSGDPIGNLIVSTKAPRTMKALARIKHRLNECSTIMFTQNGMGISEEVSERLFPDLSTRPSYLIGVVSHGIYSLSTFSIIHAGLGSVLIGVPPTPGSSSAEGTDTDEESLSQTCRYLLQQVLEAPVLSGQKVTTTELIRAQFEKLVVNSVINPLSVVFNCLNGELPDQRYFEDRMRLLLYEASDTLICLPELRDDLDSRKRFSPARLETMVLHVIKMTAENRSSMLQDFYAGRETEIDYINGYLVTRGEQRGIRCAYNRSLIEMITR